MLLLLRVRFIWSSLRTFFLLVKTEGSEIINYSAPLVPPFVSDDETRFMGMTVSVANKIIIKSIPGHMETCWSQPHEQYVLRSVGKSFRAGGEFNLCAFSSFLFHFSLSRASSDDNHLRFIEKLFDRESLAESWITISRRLFLRPDVEV